MHADQGYLCSDHDYIIVVEHGYVYALCSVERCSYRARLGKRKRRRRKIWRWPPRE